MGHWGHGPTREKKNISTLLNYSGPLFYRVVCLASVLLIAISCRLAVMPPHCKANDEDNEIFNVVHDQIIVELNNRFAERSTQLLRCITCLDPRNSFANFDEDKLIELAQIYVVDFTQYDCIVLRNQLEMFVNDARADASFTCWRSCYKDDAD
jgi:hypothetical protein